MEMTPEALRAEEKCYVRLAVWAKAHGLARIPPELVLAIAELSECAFHAGQCAGRPGGWRDDEITQPYSTKFVKG